MKITALAQCCPQKWAKYLVLRSNKEELIKFFVTEWQNNKYADFVGDKMIFVSVKQTCYKVSKISRKIRLERLEELCSTQEEADIKILLHANHAAALGHSSILIKSSDTDVEVMALYFKWGIQARFYLLTLKGLRCFFVTLRTKGGHFDPPPLLTQKPKKLQQ